MDQHCKFGHTVSPHYAPTLTIRYLSCEQGDIVLIGLREFQPDKADVIHKYTTEEVRPPVA